MRAFLKLVEIQTKLASQLPLILGTSFVLYAYDDFYIDNFLLMFISLLSFDMATTAINNYNDYKKAKKTHGYNYEFHNAIVRYNMKESTVLAIITALLTVAVVFGVLLYLNTSVVVLLLGAFSFAIGILYSFGPIPISRTPFGEIFSGTVMGFIIPFLSVFIHIYPSGIVDVQITDLVLKFDIDLYEIVPILLISLPAVITIANLMLANNISDIEDDIENKRYTLPIYIGRQRSLKLFRILYYLAYIDILLMCIFKMLPAISTVAVATLIKVKKNIDCFEKEQKKNTTFGLSVQNLVIILSSLSATIIAELIIEVVSSL